MKLVLSAILLAQSAFAPLEHKEPNVAALETQGISWPVAIDNEEKTLERVRRGILADATDLRSARQSQKDRYRRRSGCRSIVDDCGSGGGAMISLVLAGTLVSMPGAHAYRVGVRGREGTSLVVSAQAPPGWTVAFCSPRICAVGHVPLTISAT